MPDERKLNLNAMFSSKSDDWETPQDFFDALNREFCFTLDVCADERNHKVERYYAIADDALTREWRGVCWMNPPYGREIGKWVKKAYESQCTVVCLLPSRTDTAWWHDYVMKSSEIRYIRGRLKFGGSKNSAPFPSAVVIFRGGQDEGSDLM
jgi:phage N-6-adenine-methyltransferase